MVPVVGFVAPDIGMQREQFVLVNKARPLPKRLINELLPEIDTELPNDLKPNKIPSELCNHLNNNKDSPFFGLIKRASNEGTSSTAVITDTAIIDMIKHSINNYGALALYKEAGSSTTDVSSMYMALCIFWGAVKEVFPEAWGMDSKQSINAWGGDPGSRCFNGPDNAQSSAVEGREGRSYSRITKIAPYCCWTGGTWQPWGRKWNDIQNITKDIREFRGFLVQLYYSVEHV